MTLLEAAKIYASLVKTERAYPESEPFAKDQLNALRPKYHEILRDKMREEGVEFSDRFDASQKAFELVGSDHARSKSKEGATNAGRKYH